MHVPKQWAGSVDRHGDQERVQRQRCEGRHRHAVVTSGVPRRHDRHAEANLPAACLNACPESWITCDQLLIGRPPGRETGRPALYALSRLEASRSVVWRTNSSTVMLLVDLLAPPVAIQLARIAELISGWNCTARFRPRMKACDELALRASSVAAAGSSQRSMPLKPLSWQPAIRHRTPDLDPAGAWALRTETLILRARAASSCPPKQIPNTGT